MSPQLPKTFCPFAWSQLHVTPIGVVKPCCIYDGALKDENQKSVRITDSEVEKIWNGKAFKELRLKMLNNVEISECKKCYEEESVSGSSDRTRAINDQIDLSTYFINTTEDGSTTIVPSILNLKIGNKCNLKCRMCQPLDSAMVDEEFSQLSKKDPRFRSFDNANAFDYNYDETSIDLASDWIKDDLAKKNISQLLSKTVYLSLAGGETTFTQEAIDVLKFCVQENLAKNITVYMSSNLTRIADDLIELMAEFKTFTVIASIDGVNNLIEYIRYPSKWHVIKNNLQKIINAPANVKPVIAPTIQIYNILDVVEIFNFMEEIDNPKWDRYVACHLTVLIDPQHLSIRHLPKKIKDIALERLLEYQARSKFLKKSHVYSQQFELLLDTLRQEFYDAGTGISSREYLSHFLQYTNDLDVQRFQRLQDFAPELSRLLAEEGIFPTYPKNEAQNYTFYKYRDTGFRLNSEQEYAKAVVMFEKAFEMFQDDVDLLMSYGVCLKQISAGERAFGIFKRLVEISPDNTFGQKEVGLFLMAEKKYQKALGHFEKGLIKASGEDLNYLAKLIDQCKAEIS